MSIGKVLLYSGFTIGVLCFAIQIPLNIITQMEEGRSFLGSLWFFWSFFTNVINMLVVLVYAAHLSMMEGKLTFFKRHVVKATALASIIVVMIVYHLLLSATHNPVGIQAITNICMHYIAPVIFPLWWFFAGRDGKLTWSNMPRILIFPILYLVWIYIRAGLIGEYPYDFLNIAQKGVSGVAPIIGAIIVLMLVQGTIMTLLDRKKTENA